MWKRAGAELIGTALMVAVGCGSIAYGASAPVICLSFAVAVTTAILIFGPISGAHINPAVSIAFYRHGNLEKNALIPYVSAQVTGGILAAIAISTTGAGTGPTTIAANHNYLSTFFIEVFITFVLMANILWIINNSKNRIIIASWIGGWVGILAFLFGPATGASMNPARTIGPNLISEIYSSMQLYIISTIIGAWLAAELFLRIIPKKETVE